MEVVSHHTQDRPDSGHPAVDVYSGVEGPPVQTVHTQQKQQSGRRRRRGGGKSGGRRPNHNNQKQQHHRRRQPQAFVPIDTGQAATLPTIEGVLQQLDER